MPISAICRVRKPGAHRGSPLSALLGLLLILVELTGFTAAGQPTTDQSVVGSVPITGMLVRNYTPTERYAAADQALPSIQPTPSAPGVAAAEARSAPADLFRDALAAGVAAAVGLFVAFAAYAWLSPRLRSHASHLKTRQLHRKVDRDRRGPRRS